MTPRGCIACAVLLMATGFLLFPDWTDDSEGSNEDFTYVRQGDSVTVTGHGTLEYDSAWDGLTTLTIIPEGGDVSIGYSAFYQKNTLVTVNIQGDMASFSDYAFTECNALETLSIQGSVNTIGRFVFIKCYALKTVTIQGSVGLIDDFAFDSCKVLDTVTITGPIDSIASSSFAGCHNLKTVNVICSDPLNITAGSNDNGFIAAHADTVNHIHQYSATYEWTDNGKACIVHIVCANTSDHNHDENATVISTVKTPPTATEMGTTEYSVSGTYNGFSYSDTKDIQDIPVVKDNTILYTAIAAVAVAALAGACILLRRKQ